MEVEGKAKLSNILKDALSVIKTPSEFYRAMPKTGGVSDPVIFLLVMAVVVGLTIAILSLFGAGVIGALAAGFGAIVFVPIFALIGSFIGAAILFVIWKLMGSAEEYETAYRCVAYAAALYPIMTVLGLIPYLGTIVGVVWGVYLMITASLEVHKLSRNRAYTVFGILGALLLVINVGSEIAARKMAAQVGQYSEQFEGLGEQFKDMDEMTPEQAGEAVGGFFKGLNEAAQSANNATQKASRSGEKTNNSIQGANEPAETSTITDAVEALSRQSDTSSGETMTPEQAGKALGEFFSGLEEATREIREQAEQQAPAEPASASSADTASDALSEGKSGSKQ